MKLSECPDDLIHLDLLMISKFGVRGAYVYAEILNLIKKEGTADSRRLVEICSGIVGATTVRKKLRSMTSSGLIEITDKRITIKEVTHE